MDDLFIKDELPYHTAEAGRAFVLNNAASIDVALTEDRSKQNVRKLDIVPNIRRHGQRRLTALIPFGRILGWLPTF